LERRGTGGEIAIPKDGKSVLNKAKTVSKNKARIFIIMLIIRAMAMCKNAEQQNEQE